MRGVAALVVLAVAFAGCSDAPDGPGASPSPGPGAASMLHGFVFDPALRPLAGVEVKVLDTNATALTNGEGRYDFKDGVPLEQVLILVATLEGYTPSSKQLTLSVDTPVRLNFTLQPVPVARAYSVPLAQALFIECQVGLVLSQQQNMTTNCDSGTRQADQWSFAVEQDLAGAVIEVFWEPTTDLAASLGARLETLELGQLNLVLGQAVGTSPLRIVVPQAVAERYYSAGGLMRLSVYAEPNVDEQEAGIGASVILEQPVDAYATLFYVQPPPPTYSIANAG